MVKKKKVPLRKIIVIAAGILLLVAAAAETVGVVAEGLIGWDRTIHFFLAALGGFTAVAVFVNTSRLIHLALPIALGILFYESYCMASGTVLLSAVISSIAVFLSAVLLFMLIRVLKV